MGMGMNELRVPGSTGVPCLNNEITINDDVQSGSQVLREDGRLSIPGHFRQSKIIPDRLRPAEPGKLRKAAKVSNTKDTSYAFNHCPPSIG